MNQQKLYYLNEANIFLFANCGLPYYIGGTIKERDALLVQTPEAMHARFNIDVRVQNEVIDIDRENMQVIVKDLAKNTTYKESYDVLVLSPGSSPLKPPIPGIDLPNIFSLWNIPDTDAIKAFVDDHELKTATGYWWRLYWYRNGREFT